jgi:hypothetical protein
MRQWYIAALVQVRVLRRALGSYLYHFFPTVKPENCAKDHVGVWPDVGYRTLIATE